MQVGLEYLEDWELYRRVLVEGICRARQSVWIATANLKDVRVPGPVGFRPIAFQFAQLCAGGVEVRVLHGSGPSEAFLHSFRESGLNSENLFAARRCPRVHLKAVLIDMQQLYLGSANITGAGLGAKSEDRRNFEIGILTADPVLIDRVASLFRVIWDGKMCEGCGRRNICYCPLEQMA